MGCFDVKVQHVITINKCEVALVSYTMVTEELINLGYEGDVLSTLDSYDANVSEELISYSNDIFTDQPFYKEDNVKASRVTGPKIPVYVSIVCDINAGIPLYTIDGHLFTINGVGIYVLPVKTTDYE